MAKRVLFIDTSYVYAIINPNVQWHAKAVEWQTKVVADDNFLVTTQFVLAEIADGLSAVKYRKSAVEVVRSLIENPKVAIAEASTDLFDHGLELYESRLDKSWGLTDCFSFVTMRIKGLTDALTTDDHFRQAGFNALLLS